jgi:hypothetical protein
LEICGSKCIASKAAEAYDARTVILNTDRFTAWKGAK